jgi:predicted CXXCH cytochrome family protein
MALKELKEKRYVHAPEMAGFCRICHDSHRSRQAFLLLAEPRQLCFYCHSPKDVAKNKAHEDGQAPCTQCHDPHADNRYFLRSTSDGTPLPVKGEPAPVRQEGPAAP